MAAVEEFGLLPCNRRFGDANVAAMPSFRQSFLGRMVDNRGMKLSISSVTLKTVKIALELGQHSWDIQEGCLGITKTSKTKQR